MYEVKGTGTYLHPLLLWIGLVGENNETTLILDGHVDPSLTHRITAHIITTYINPT